MSGEADLPFRRHVSLAPSTQQIAGTNLTALDMADNQISDISALKGLTNLTELYLSGNKISEAQIRELKTALPETNISSNLDDDGI